MDEAADEDQESSQGMPAVKRVKKVLDTLWCHLCKIEFVTCDEFCMHIMKKHRPSSKYYEGNNENSKVQKDHLSKIVQDDDDDSEDLNISVSSHEIAEKSGNDKWLGNSSGTSAVPETLGATQIGKRREGSSTIFPNMNPILHNFPNVQNPASCNSRLNENPFVNQQSENYFFVGNQGTVPKIDVNSVINEQIMQQMSHLQFTFNSKNILKWDKDLKERFRSLQFPLPSRILKCIQGVSEILLQFCRLSPDEEAVLLVQKILEEIEDILDRHKIFMQMM